MRADHHPSTTWHERRPQDIVRPLYEVTTLANSRTLRNEHSSGYTTVHVGIVWVLLFLRSGPQHALIIQLVKQLETSFDPGSVLLRVRVGAYYFDAERFLLSGEPGFFDSLAAGELFLHPLP